MSIDDYLEILTDEEVKDFAAMNFSEHFQSIREEQIAKSLYIFLTIPDEVERFISDEVKRFF